MKKFKKVSKEYKGLQEVIETYNIYKDLLGNIETSEEMLAEDDAEMQQMEN